MGHGLGVSLLRHGYGLAVLAHRRRAPVDDLVARGASEATTLAELAHAEVIVLCLSTTPVVEETVAELKPHLRRGQIVLDAGTSAPRSSRRLAAALRVIGVGFADIPLTGGPEEAARGELGVLCGAEDDTFASIRPLLQCFATTIRHFGPPGSGHAAKLVSNYLVTGMVALVADAFAAARAAGIDWADLYAVMQNGSGRSGVLRKMVEPALHGDFDGYRFSLANAAKDIGHYADLAGELGCATRLTESVAQVFAEALEAGLGGRNVSRLLDPSVTP
jgi:hypothetical protein